MLHCALVRALRTWDKVAMQASSEVPSRPEVSAETFPATNSQLPGPLQLLPADALQREREIVAVQQH